MTGTAKGGIVGHAPTVTIGRTERAKYEEVWKHPEYRAIAPGEHYVEKFLAQAKPQPGDTVTDFGCGTGRGSVKLNGAKLDVTMMDFAANCLDEYVRELCEKYPQNLRFICHDLAKWPYPVKRAKFGYCTDMLEHLPTEQVDKTLWNILRAARTVFFAINTRPDKAGQFIGEDLHLTVQPFDWWKEKLESLHCNVLWSEDAGGTVFFYATAYANQKDLYDAMVINISEETIRDQIVENLRLGLPEVSPYEVQPDAEVVLLAGGPSLNDYADEIYQKAAPQVQPDGSVKDGLPVVTVNGTYGWALNHRIRPAATVVLDGREFNKRFVDPVMPGVKYLLSSMCHPDLVKSVPREQVTLWHSGASPKVREAIDTYVRESGQRREWWPVYGGSTVALRAIILLRMLGFKKLHIYGMDSCVRRIGSDAIEHHAYVQPENDSPNIVDIEVGGRTFSCHLWMWSQAHEFMDQVRALGDEMEMEIYGDGLIAHCLATAAELPIPEGVEPKQYHIVDTEELEDKLGKVATG